MEQYLKDELIRVRAREKRYKVEAEAQIAGLKQQLEALTVSCSTASASLAELEKRCRKLEEEKTQLKKQADSTAEDLRKRCQELEKQNAQFKAQAESTATGLQKLARHCQIVESENLELKGRTQSSASELEKRCQELATENVRYRERCEALENVARKADNLRNQLPGIEDILGVATFLMANKGDDKELVALGDRYIRTSVAHLVCRCGETDVLVALWKYISKLVEAGADEHVAKSCQLALLNWHNLCNQTQLKTIEKVGYGIVFKSYKTVRLPGLVTAKGKILVKPLRKN